MNYRDSAKDGELPGFFRAVLVDLPLSSSNTCSHQAKKGQVKMLREENTRPSLFVRLGSILLSSFNAIFLLILVLKEKRSLGSKFITIEIKNVKDQYKTFNSNS